jgi:DNA-binding MarR family transcriptional regulator
MTKQLDQLLFAMELRSVVGRLYKKIRKDALKDSNFSLTEISTLSLLSKQGDMLPSELALAENITSQSMSTILNHLQEAGYISRIISKEDKRKVIIRISVSGNKQINQIREQLTETLASAIDEIFSKEEKKQLKKSIELLNRLAD